MEVLHTSDVSSPHLKLMLRNGNHIGVQEETRKSTYLFELVLIEHLLHDAVDEVGYLLLLLSSLVVLFIN